MVPCQNGVEAAGRFIFSLVHISQAARARHEGTIGSLTC